MVTGMGCVSALGLGAALSHQRLLEGGRAPGLPTLFRADCKEYGLVFEALAAPPVLGAGSRTNAMAFLAADEALAAARLELPSLDPARVGVCLGTTVGCSLNDEVFYRYFHGQEMPGPEAFVRYLSGNPAQALARRLGLRGPAVSVGNACASGTDALGLARRWLLDGLCDAVLAGGCDELCRTPYLGFTSLLNTSPEPCRPFDRARRGLNLGEGAAVLILESAAAAQARKAPVQGRISGYGSAVDAHHATAPHPEGRGLKAATARALGEAGLKPADIAFINAHGTATPANDQVEGRSMLEIFGPGAVLVSTKGATGHALGAAGALEAAFTLMALNDGQVGPTLGFEEMDPAIGLAATRAKTPVKGSAAISNSLAFGGQNSVLVLQRA
jgi:3-oxoacyl-[acyl-carrier-protein] synthase-1/3-oxoacyl-[acyl-carrier-protein] synthase II